MHCHVLTKRCNISASDTTDILSYTSKAKLAKVPVTTMKTTQLFAIAPMEQNATEGRSTDTEIP